MSEIKKRKVVFDAVRQIFKDGFYNTLSGFGKVGVDPNKSVNYESQDFNGYYWEQVFNDNWLAKKIVNVFYDDAMRNGFNLNLANPEDKTKMNRYLKDLSFNAEFERAAKMARLKGGSLLFIGAMDGQDPSEPLNEENISTIAFLRVFERDEVSILSYYNDVETKKHGQPESYYVTPYDSSGNAYTIIIHESRVVKLDGIFTTTNKKAGQDGWSDGVLQALNTSLNHYSNGINSVNTIVQNLISNVIKLGDLESYLEDPDALKARIEASLQSMSLIGAHVIGEGEEFTKEHANVTGLDKIISVQMRDIASAASIPMTKLFGEQLGSLAGADSSTENYFDQVSSYRETRLRDAIERLVYLILKEKSVSFSSDEFKLEFNPLKQESKNDQLENQKKQAEIDKIYIETEVLMADEVAENRFGGEEYSYQTKLDDMRNAERAANEAEEVE